MYSQRAVISIGKTHIQLTFKKNSQQHTTQYQQVHEDKVIFNIISKFTNNQKSIPATNIY